MKTLGVVVAIAVAMTGCAGESQVPTTTSPRSIESFGQELFEERVVGVSPGCVTCHSREKDVTLVGPSLFSVVSPVPELSNAEYVRQSILDPDAYVVPGYVAGQMTGGWDQYLTREQIDSLVELLASE